MAASMAFEASVAWRRRWRGGGVGGGVGGVAAASAVSHHQWASGAMVAWGGSRGVDGGVGVDSPHYA